MTDAEKLANYDHILQIINDALALEKHFAREGKSCDAVQFLRADAYKNIVDQTLGPDVAEPTRNTKNSNKGSRKKNLGPRPMTTSTGS